MATINTLTNIRVRIKQALISIIYVYRFSVSLLLGYCCRFEPTCSSYAIEAIQLHGCLKGCYLMIRRLLRCHPWHSGGHDPVPLTHTNRSPLC
jgi:putative membrane protein insertion efficiency factor